jgi:hypothetical protein
MAKRYPGIRLHPKKGDDVIIRCPLLLKGLLISLDASAEEI